jgi:hypothetical protein
VAIVNRKGVTPVVRRDIDPEAAAESPRAAGIVAELTGRL